MGRKKMWSFPFKALKVKISEEYFERYKLVLKGKKKTIQQDLEDYIGKTISQ
jgi:hypothetical protein